MRSALSPGGDGTEQIVGRERNHVVCYRQLVREVVVSRRVNSNVGHLLLMLDSILKYVSLITVARRGSIVHSRRN